MTERAKKLLLLYYKQSRKIRIVSGLPHLTFKAKKAGTLKNYRIYGQTSRNLFDFGEWSKNINANNDNSLVKSIDGITITANSNDAFTTPYAYVHEGVYKIYVKPNTNYLLSWVSNNNLYGRVFIFKNGISDGTHAVNTNNNTTKYLLFGTDADTAFITLRFGVETAGDTITYSKIMLNEGSTPLPYEPYGESVGDRTANLCNNIWVQGGIDSNTGNVVTNPSIVCCDFIPVKPNVTYSCSRTVRNNYNNLRCYGANKDYLGTGADLANKSNPLKQWESFGTFMITDARVSYIRFNDNSNSLDTKYMLVEGAYTAETMPVYEPYGYKVPVTVSDGTDTQTTTIYLDAPLEKSGNNADYIDYETQKRHNSDGTNEDVTLPEITVTAGMNTLTAGTEVQPSYVEISGRIKAAGGD